MCIILSTILKNNFEKQTLDEAIDLRSNQPRPESKRNQRESRQMYEINRPIHKTREI
jgi:hypothetical protein